MTVEHEDCLLCMMEDADADRIVFRDDRWAVEVVPGYEVKGWFILRTRRHAERIVALDDAELETFAFRARDLIAAVTEVTSAPATYLMLFGESYPHFHVLVVARDDDVPGDRRTGDILKLRLEQCDVEGSLALATQVRAALGSYRSIDASSLHSLDATS
jgi:diadenosine tetraphosphate (Ap4A) HIT family hydrolase